MYESPRRNEGEDYFLFIFAAASESRRKYGLFFCLFSGLIAQIAFERPANGFFR